MLVGVLNSHKLALLFIAGFTILRAVYSPIVASANLHRGLNPILLRKAFVAMLFDKVLKLSLAAQRTHQAKLMNMTSSDVAIIESALSYLPELLASSISALAILAIVYSQIGYTAILAFLVIVAYLILQLPIQAALQRQRSRVA